MPDLALVIDRDGRILYANREAPGQHLVGTSLFDHDLGAEAEARMRAALHQVFTPGKPMSYEVESTGADDETVWYVSRWSPIEREGEVVAGLIVASDITRRVMLERLDMAEQDVILDSAAEGILGLDDEGSVTFANAAAARPARHQPGGADGPQHPRRRALRATASTPPHEADECPVLLSITHGIVQHMEDDVFWRARARASRSPTRRRRSSTAASSPGAVLTFNDVTERKRFEAQLQYLADHDPVTGLYNRRRFEQELARHLSYDARYGTGGAVLALDLDNFKYVNDTMGHKAGDEVIASVARNIRERIRESDTLARLGGDEFARPAPRGRHRAGAVGGAHDHRRRPVARRSRPAGQQLRVTTSVGITTFGNREVDGEALLVEADLAMYDAKAAGRDRFALYTPMAVREAQIESRLAWVGRVRSALDEDRFIALRAARHLARDRRARPARAPAADGRGRGEVVLPGSFLPSAERFGLMPAVDRWVVRQAVRLLAEHRSGAAARGERVGRVDGRRGAHPRPRGGAGGDGRRSGPARARGARADRRREPRRDAPLRPAGARTWAAEFALDDFGAGFGSFYYLKYLPFDYLKIDGDFIHSLPANRTDQLVVQAVADIARGLGKRTIAEFVGDDDTRLAPARLRRRPGPGLSPRPPGAGRRARRRLALLPALPRGRPGRRAPALARRSGSGSSSSASPRRRSISCALLGRARPRDRLAGLPSRPPSARPAAEEEQAERSEPEELEDLNARAG